MRFIEDLGITGHLQISKLYKGKPEEIVFDDHNVIVSGMGVGLSHMFSGSGSDIITDYQLDRFQVGVSGDDSAGSAIYQLSGPLTSVAEYGGVASNLGVVSAFQIRNGALTTAKTSVYGLIPFKNVTRINDTSVRYTLILDEDTANYTNYAARHTGSWAVGDVGARAAASINEIGLFMKNPRNIIGGASLLVAYRKFTGIVKTSDFSLVFRWTLNF